MSAAEWQQVERLSADEPLRHRSGTWGGLGDLFDRGGRTVQVKPWQPADEPVSLDEYRAGVALEKAQRALHAAAGAAVEPLPCRQPGPGLWLSEDRRERQKAAELCQSCPVLAECGAVGAAAPLDTWGVFGGHDYGADDLAELRAVSGAVVNGRDGAAMRARRDELLRQLRTDGWRAVELAEAAGITKQAVYMACRGDGRRSKAQEHASTKVQRRARHEAEVAERADDPRIRRLRQIALPAGRFLRDAVLRAERAALVLALWAEDPRFWTNERLAVAIGVKTAHAAQGILREGQRDRNGRHADGE